MDNREYQVCSNCVMDTTDSKIIFDENGVCDHCNNFYKNILPNWHPNEKGAKQLENTVARMKFEGKDKEYDSIIGISGGVDSSYLLYYATKVLKLKPLAFSVDTGWNTETANNNINNIIQGLGLKLHNIVVNEKEMRDLQLAYFKSQVPYQDTPQDHVIFAALYNYAIKYGIKYVLTGGNYSTECVREPNEWVYMNDLRQLKDIHKRFGNVPLKTVPLCSMFKYRLYYRYFKGMKVIKPLDMIPYTKENAISILQEKFSWKPYANKHYESIFTRFYEGYWLINKFGYDKRKAYFSSLILTKQMTRGQALEILKEVPYRKEDAMKDLRYICEKMGISDNEFLIMMSGSNKDYTGYKNNAKWIDLMVKIARTAGVEKRNLR